MTDKRRRTTIVFVTEDRDSDLFTGLRDDASYDVERAYPTTDFPSLEDAVGVVIETDRPESARELLERCGAADASVPTVVAPRRGSERLAATALRAGATEYVPSDAEATVKRVIDAIESAGDDVGRTERTLQPDADGVHDDPLKQIFETTLPDEAFVLDKHGTYLDVSVHSDTAALYTVSPDELIGTQLTDAFPEDVAAPLQACIDRTLETGDEQSIEYGAETVEGTRWFEAKVVPIDGTRSVFWLARDVTDRVQRERELRRHRDYLETLDQINSVVGRVIQTLVGAPTRSTIEHEVCEQLVESDLYCGSWIAELTGERTVYYRTGAGEATTFLDRVRELSTDRDRPVVTAMRTGEIQVANGILDEQRLPEELQEAAEAHNIRSAIAVPISHEDAVYGSLAVLASRDDAFSEREQEAFRLLGETIGFAINAVKNRRLLFADTAVELELRISGGDTFSFDLSEEYDCNASLEWTGTTNNGRTYQYVTFEGIDGETVLERATAHETIEECRLIHGGDEQCTLEIRLRESGVRTLADHGATIREITVSDGCGTILAEVPRDADVREIVDALKRVYENTELVARREIDRPVHTAAERRERILDRLTDRQLTTLRLAYYGGYFDWPRGSTGEEIAESMDVTPPTMHQHLRKGLDELLSEFFEEGGGTG